MGLQDNSSVSSHSPGWGASRCDATTVEVSAIRSARREMAYFRRKLTVLAGARSQRPLQVQYRNWRGALAACWFAGCFAILAQACSKTSAPAAPRSDVVPRRQTPDVAPPPDSLATIARELGLTFPAGTRPRGRGTRAGH